MTWDSLNPLKLQMNKEDSSCWTSILILIEMTRFGPSSLEPLFLGVDVTVFHRQRFNDFAQQSLQNMQREPCIGIFLPLFPLLYLPFGVES